MLAGHSLVVFCLHSKVFEAEWNQGESMPTKVLVVTSRRNSHVRKNKRAQHCTNCFAVILKDKVEHRGQDGLDAFSTWHRGPVKRHDEPSGAPLVCPIEGRVKSFRWDEKNKHCDRTSITWWSVPESSKPRPWDQISTVAPGYRFLKATRPGAWPFVYGPFDQ